MCGICGVYHYRDRHPVDERLLAQMIAVMRHRGPDDDGRFVGDGVGLGMRRLSVIDLESGAQPIFNEDRDIVTVCNGEIYNFKELRALLGSLGHLFVTQTDTESIVHGYEQWGFDSLVKLNGMFGLAIWDDRDRTLVLARDPYGIKPLYYHDDGSSLWFASEIKSLLSDPRIPRVVDTQALDTFLALTYVPAPATAFAGIRKIPPGHAIVCTTDGASLRRFHQHAPDHLEKATEDEVIERLQELIAAAVERQMVADVPVGALLSGGIDSTTTATIMARLLDRPIDTFTVGFQGDAQRNELAFARETAQRIGSRHHQTVVSADEYRLFLPYSVWHLEEPVATDSTLAYYKVCRLAREHVTVVLSGQGADEPFGGYPRHVGECYSPQYRRLPQFVQAQLLPALMAHLPRNERLKRATRSLGIADDHERRLAVWSVLDADVITRLIDDRVSDCSSLASIGSFWKDDVAGLDGLSQMLYLDARLSLADNLLMYGDKMSMAVSLEARVPFLDLELMRYAESIPSSLKIRRGVRKHILKRAVAKWIPDEVIGRKKIGFTPPIDRWLRTELSAYTTEVLLAEGSACRLFFDRKTLQRLIEDHVQGREDYKKALLSLLVFESWHEQFIAPTHEQLRKRMLMPIQAEEVGCAD